MRVFEQNTEESFSRQIESKKSKYGTDTQSLREMHAKLAVVANNGRGPKYRKKNTFSWASRPFISGRLFEKNDTVDPYAIASILDYPDSQRNTSFLPDQDMFFSMTKKIATCWTSKYHHFSHRPRQKPGPANSCE